MRLMLLGLYSVVALSLFACTNKDAEEPVEPSADGEAATEGAADASAPDQAATLDEGAENPEMDTATEAAPEAAPAPAPVAEQPAPSPVSEPAMKPIPGAECKNIAKFSERKKCFADAQKAAKQ